MSTIRVGTRGSKMALVQTTMIVDGLAAVGIYAEPATFKTRGDQDQVGRLGKLGGKGGAFVADLRDRLQANDIQAIMHSLKDVPGNEEDAKFVLGAYLERQSPNDVLALRPGLELRDFEKNGGRGRKIGTSSVRRKAFLAKLYPEAEVIHFRGSADGRLNKLYNNIMQETDSGISVGPADALVLAQSGLERIGLGSHIRKVFSVEEMIPAASQGIVVAECLRSAWTVRQALAAIDHIPSRRLAMAEREVLWVLDGHCESPIAVHARSVGDDELEIYGAVFGVDGAVASASHRGSITAPRTAGRVLAEILLSMGARAIVDGTK